MELNQSLQEMLAKHFPAGTHFLVAVSGGGDSSALLHLLRFCLPPPRLTAAYIDHGLRPAEAAREKKWLAHLTSEMGIEFVSTQASATAYARENGFSIEDAARRLRYQELERIRQEVGAAWIATGHTADDQVETLFIRLIRGCGLSGLTGMRWRRGRIVRPLLTWPKKALADYLAAQGIVPCHDSSNDDPRFLRNRVRRELLPFLRQRFNPGMDAACLRMMAILDGEEALLQNLTDEAFARVVREEVAEASGERPSERLSEHPGELLRERRGTSPVLTIAIAPFLDLPVALRRRLLERAGHCLAINTSFILIENLLRQFPAAANGAEWHWPLGTRVVRQNDSLIFSQPQGRRPWRGRADD